MASIPGISAQYNKKSSAVKRIMQEARELVREPSTDFAAHPLDTDIFEWHFTIRGPEETEFEGGLYHGRILLPNNYPFAPPSLMFLTPNGRFELHKKVCLSITGYHPEYWQPAWGIRTVLVAVMGFLPTKSKGAIGGLDTSVEARKVLAVRSKTWVCKTCNLENEAILPNVDPENAVKAELRADEMPPEFSFGYEADKKKAEGEQDNSEGKDQPASSTSATNGATQERVQITSAEPSEENINTSIVEPLMPTHLQPMGTTQAPQPTLGAPRTATDGIATDVSATPSSTLTQRQGVPAATTSTPTPTFVPAATSASAPPTPTARPPATASNHRADSSIPLWLDALILAFGGILVAMVIRRFI